MPKSAISSHDQPLGWRLYAGLTASVFISCLVGLYSRPIGYLAAFWPVNAIMLGLLLRHRKLGYSPLSWILSLLAYIVADLLAGSSLFVAVGLNAANVVGVAAGWWALVRLPDKVLRLQHQRSVLYLFMGCLVAAIGCAVVGAPASRVAFDVPLQRAFVLWLASEFYNFILIVPLFLAAPRGWFWRWKGDEIWIFPHFQWSLLLPLVALFISEMLALSLGGPGAIAYIVPAMVWCAMAYGVFPTTVLNLVVCLGKTMAIFMGVFSFSPDHVWDVISLRTGIALFSIAPLAVACAYALRLQALQKLSYAVSHDYLTGLLARRALMERGQKLLSRLEEEGQPVSVMMIDIDHFKKVNDQYGHAQGDVVLQEFATLVRQSLRPEDLLGRMGGEEFALLLPRTPLEQAMQIGQRLCDLMQAHRFKLPNHDGMYVTLSIGLHAVHGDECKDSLEQLLSKADEALYKAKHNGRNRVCQFVSTPVPSSSTAV